MRFRGDTMSVLVRVLNRLVSPLGLKCIEIKEIPPALELPPIHLRNTRVLPKREDVLPLMPKGKVVAEVGVAFGHFSRKMIDIMQPKCFVAIDLFELHKPTWFWGQDYQDQFKGGTHEDYYRRRFEAEIHNGTVVIKKGYSSAIIQEFPDGYFDLIYLDAAHDYDSVSQDLAACKNKINLDGFLILNDYTILDPLIMEPYGIVQATNELCIREGWEIIYFTLHRHMFCDVVLKKLR
jgi:hypothetical protein